MKKKLTRPDFLFVDVELDFRMELDFRPVAILNRVCVGGTRRWRPLRPCLSGPWRGRRPFRYFVAAVWVCGSRAVRGVTRSVRRGNLRGAPN